MLQTLIVQTCQNTDDEILQKISECEAETIKFSEWKRKDVNHKGKLTKRMMIENVQLSKTEFMTMFRRDLIEFRKHVQSESEMPI